MRGGVPFRSVGRFVRRTASARGNAFALAALLALSSSAGARAPRGPQAGALRFPSDQIPDVGTLQNAIASPTVGTIVCEQGTYRVAGTLFVFGRDDLVICGATGDPRDVVFELADPSPAPANPPPLLEIVQARRIALRGLTLRTHVTTGAALLVDAAFSPVIESYAEDVVVDRCVLEGYVGVQASVRTRNLALTRSRVNVTASPIAGLPEPQGGVGVLWEDGDGLFVSRTRFASDVPSVAGVFVRGAQTGDADGRRARDVLLTGNVVAGDFARGFLIDDVVGLRLRRNRVGFPGPLTASALPGVPAGSGRVGAIVARANASSLTEDYELFGNVFRNAYYGAWLVNAGQGVVRANDFGSCGSRTSDPGFVDASVNGGVDHGGALRLNLQFDECPVEVERNDMRPLRSPVAEPAVVVFPGGAEPLCFSTTDRNRTDRGRELFLGASDGKSARR